MPRFIDLIVPVLLMCALTACKEPSPPETEEKAPAVTRTLPTFSVDYLRLDLRYNSTADTVELLRIARIKANELPRASGSHMALAYVGSELVDAQFVPFSDELFIEGNLTEGQPFSETIPVTEQPGTAFLKWQKGIDRIDIRNEKGVSLTIDAKDIPSETPGSVSMALTPGADSCPPVGHNRGQHLVSTSIHTSPSQHINVSLLKSGTT